MNMPKGLVYRASSCAALGVLFCVSTVLAQQPAPRVASQTERRIAQAAPRKRDAQSVHRAVRRLAYAPDRYMLFLADDPVAKHFSTRDQLQTQAAVNYRQQIEAKQQSLMQELASHNIHVVSSVSLVMNAVFVSATPDRLSELKSMPGVIGVMPERVVFPSLNKANALINATAAWTQSAIGGQGNAGNGIKIGILDTGIDAGSVHTSPAFVDTGFTAPAGFPKCNAAVNGAPSDCGLYTNNKVIVARSYISMINSGNCLATSLTGACTSTAAANPAVSTPDDPSARDRDGHGSAVAAAAAGIQNSAGTVPFSGVAPKAFLGSYKIFGSGGMYSAPSESVIIKALDDAISDGMNVVNLSGGAIAVAGAKDDVQCGNPSGVWCDPLAHAFEVAAENGTVITVAAGNYGSDGFGDIYYNTILSPGTAPSVITVGATVNSHVFNPTVSVNGSGVPSNLIGIAANLSDSEFYPSSQGANSGVLVDVTTLGDNGQACSTIPGTVTGYPSLGPLADKYALIQRSPTNSATGCSFDTKAQNATAAGAIGIIFYMADSTTLVSPNGICYYNTNDECDLVGPGVIVSLADGNNLKAYVDANPGTVVTIDTGGAEEALPNSSAINTMASYSSLGPAIDGSIKPDLVAPGGFDPYQSAYPEATNGLYTVGESYDPDGELYSSNGFVATNGTSFSSALAAGAAALVLQAHSGASWSALQVKSALVNNTAVGTVTSDDNGNTVDVQEIGAGLMNVNGAVTASVTAVPSTLSFGYLATGATFPKTIPVTVTNTGSTSVTLAAAVSVGVAATNASVTVSPTSLTLAGGKSGTLTVSLGSAVPAAGEYNGAVTLTSVSPAVSLSLPYMFMVGAGTTAVNGSGPVVNPLYDLADYQYYGSIFGQGSVGQDVGQVPAQVLDGLGVPIANTPVTYTISPGGSLTLGPVPGVAGTTGNANAYQPSNCTPSTSTSSVVCNTDSYGIAWVELVLGSTATGSTNPATIDLSAQGSDITDYVVVLPAPSLSSVQDDAAFGTTIAPGSYIALFGSNFADPNYIGNTTTGDKVDVTYSSGRLPLNWDFVQVSFDAAASGSLPAISVPGYVEYVNTGQINAFVPWELTGYPSVQVKEVYDYFGSAIYSNVKTVQVSTYTPAFFMYASGSVFIADAIDGNCASTGYIVATSCPANPGDTIELYANGLGPTTNQPASGSPAPSGSSVSQLAQTTTTPVVMIGGQQAQVSFAGLAPGYVGLYQINATVPSGLAAGNQPITISIGGKTSPSSVTASGTTYQIVLPVK